MGEGSYSSSNCFFNFLSERQPVHIAYRVGYENEIIANSQTKNSFSTKVGLRKARDKKS
jgi:hypothetical protein